MLKEEPNSKKIKEWLDQGSTVVYFIVNDVCKGAVAIQDVIREEAYDALDDMLKLKLDLTMCTGDIQSSAEHIVDKLIKRIPNAK